MADLSTAGAVYVGGTAVSSIYSGVTKVWPAAPPPSSVTPDQIANLNIWLKADAITGVADGASLPSWVDSSSNSLSPAQATTAVQPTYTASAVNGLPAVQFSGAQYLDESTVTDTAPISAFIVAKATGYSTDHGSLFGSTLAGGLNVRVDNSTSLRLVSDGTAGIGAATTASPGTAAYRVFTSAYGGPGTAYLIGLDGTTLATATSSVSIPSDVKLRVGADHFNSPALGWQGFIAEFITYSRVLTATEIAQVDSYLADKYAITVTDHT